MSDEQSLGDIRERIARMEQRQIQLHEMITLSLSNFGDLANRTRKLEDDANSIRTKLWLAGLVGGAIFSTAWAVFKRRIGIE
jgi:predicted nuclease with TOPRIM domain